ncbi:MAG: hypothetical protein AAFR04_08885 [Pseudomonadota bacterium]
MRRWGLHTDAKGMRARTLGIAMAAAAALNLGVASVNAGETVRIEPRAYYGATVTIEAGVRVFRPLPPTKRVIINPGGRTPLSLSFEDVEHRTYNQSHNYNYNYNGGAGGYGPGGVVGGFGHAGKFGRNGRFGRFGKFGRPNAGVRGPRRFGVRRGGKRH